MIHSPVKRTLTALLISGLLTACASTEGTGSLVSSLSGAAYSAVSFGGTSSVTSVQDVSSAVFSDSQEPPASSETGAASAPAEPAVSTSPDTTSDTTPYTPPTTSPEEKAAIDSITTQDPVTPAEDPDTRQEAEVVTTAAPVVTNTQRPVASGSLVKENSKAQIDYSNTSDGYVMVRYIASTSQKLKVRVAGPGGTTYTYSLTPSSSWTTFPLSDGNGSYKVTVYEQVEGTSYATVLSVTFSASLDDEFGPFLLPNQYVNYADAPRAVAKAAELTAGISDPLEKVKAIYDYIVNNISYDYDKASSVQSGYLVDMDSVLASGKGICFDYAAIMAGMLRSQSVPTKLVVGYAGTTYHAWINVYTSDKGWVDAAIYFDGVSWRLMDPTFASSANRSSAIYTYITNDSNYTAKYFY